MKNYITGFLLWILLLASCVFGLEDENFVKVEKTPDPSFLGDLEYSYGGYKIPFYPVKDTIWLEESISLRLNSRRLLRWDLIIDGDTLMKQSYIYDLEKGKREPGAYSLTVIQYISSGTGSLADKLSSEYIMLKKDYVLMIGPDNYVPKIKSVKVNEGTVQLSWNSYRRDNFQAYEVIKYPHDKSKFRSFIIEDPLQTTFNDTSYVGKKVDYEIRIWNGGEPLASERYPAEFSYDPDMRLTKIAENRFRLSWTLPPFYKNVKFYEVKIGQTELVRNIPAETPFLEFEEQLNFGSGKSFVLVLYAKVEEFDNPNPSLGNFPDRVPHGAGLTYGEKIPSFRSLGYSKSERAFFLLSYNYGIDETWPFGIYKLDENTLEVKNWVLLNSTNSGAIKGFVMAPDGNSLFLLFNNGNLQSVNTNDLSLGEVVATNSYLNTDKGREDFSVSNNDFIVLHDQIGSVKVVDFKSGQVLLATESAVASHISADGNFFINGNIFYSFTGGAFTKSAVLSYEEILYARFINNESKVFIATAGKSVLYDYRNHIELKSINADIAGLYRGHLDQTTKIFAFFNIMKGMQLLNIETGEFIEMESVVFENCLLEGNILFLNYGYALKDYLR